MKRFSWWAILFVRFTTGSLFLLTISLLLFGSSTVVFRGTLVGQSGYTTISIDREYSIITRAEAAAVVGLSSRWEFVRDLEALREHEAAKKDMILNPRAPGLWHVSFQFGKESLSHTTVHHGLIAAASGAILIALTGWQLYRQRRRRKEQS